MQHLPDSILKSKAATLDPLDLTHLLGRSLKIQQKEMDYPPLSHSDTIMLFHLQFPSMMDWYHRYLNSVVGEHAGEPSCQISNTNC